jgi:RNA polymerase sigma factor (sigma-70 family)
MDSLARISMIADPDAPEGVLRSLAREGERGRLLRAQLAARFPARSEEEIEDAVQSACRSFLAEAEGISEPGRVYSWIRTAAYHALLRELEHQGWERAVDPVELGRAKSLTEDAGPAEELIALENEAELGALVRDVADSLSERRRKILALWGAEHSRSEIAARLGLSERAVKRDLLAIMEEARVVLAREAGGGCLPGEPQVLRFAYGLATSAEAAQARLHLDRCRRCSGLAERLEAWREKAGAVLPVPAAEAASPGLVERVVSHGAHAIGSVKQQILGGGSQVSQQAAVGVYARAVDPGALAGIRPGAVAVFVAGCLAVGGGATYCAEQGVDPLGAAKNLIAGTQEGEPSPSPSPPAATEPAPLAPAPTSEEAPPVETTVTDSPADSPEPQPESEPEPEPEASFEPSAPVSAPSSEEVVAEPATESAPVVRPSPAPVPSRDAPQFGGP